MRLILVAVFLASIELCVSQAPIETVANSQTVWTGVAVSRTGRVFVNFPRWDGSNTLSVAEIKPDGTQEAFPDKAWNEYVAEADPASHLVCVQSVYVDAEDNLWILDSGNPYLRGVIPGGPKLLKVNLGTGKIISTIFFDSTVVVGNSYLNDFRIDLKQHFAYITDSGSAAIVVVNLKERSARRLLSDHYSTRAQDVSFSVEGVTIGAKIHADGIALDGANDLLYFKSLTGNDLYRIQARWLRNLSVSRAELEAHVDSVAHIGITDGMEFGHDGNLYFTALEHNEIRRLTKEGAIETVVYDVQLKWPDSMALLPDGTIYCTTSQLHLGRNRTEPNKLFRISIK